MKTPETTPSRCPECDGEIPPGQPKGLCFTCALKGSLELVDTVPSTGPSPASLSPTESKNFGDYELLEEIARGGMGIVYRARQKSLDRTVAVKMILSGQFAGKEEVLRFRAEAESAAKLQHPHIVRIHETGECDGQPYFSMDYVAGGNLAALVREKPLPAKRAAGYVKTITEAIHYAHEQGILHRDLKPSNVLIDRADQPHVADFGLAKRMTRESFLTVTGDVMGSPNFMPPEQAGAKTKAGRYSDVYGLGAILFYLVTGRPPFVAENVAETLHHVLNTEPVSPRLLNPSVPQDIATICLKCLEKEPAKRYQAARELAVELNRFLNGKPIHARPATRPERVWRWCRRKPAVASLGLATLVLLVAVAVGSPIAAWRIDRERQRAEREELTARQRGYASDMNLGQQAVANNNLGRALEMLNRHRPLAGQRDLRGWEWRYLWQQCQNDALFTLCQKSNSIASLAVSHDGKLLAIGEHDKGGLSVWDLSAREETVRLPAGEGQVRVAFSPRELLLAFSIQSGMSPTNREFGIRLWDCASKRTVAEFPLGGPCRGLAFSEDGRKLVTSTANPDAQIVLWQVPEGTKLASHPAPQVRDSSGSPFASTRDLSVVAHGMSEGRIRMLDLSTGKVRWTVQAADEHITALVFSADEKVLVSASGYGASPILLWDAASGKEVGRLEGPPIRGLAVLPDGKTLASASANQSIHLWNLATTQAMDTLRGHRLEVWRLALLPDHRTLVSGCKDGTVCLWDIAAIRHSSARLTLPAAMAAWRFSPDSKSVLTLDRQGGVTKWKGIDFQQAEPLMNIGTNFSFWWSLISQDCRLLAVGSTDGTVRVWDVNRRTLLQQLAGLGSPWPCEFLARQNKLVVADLRDSSHHEWDLTTWLETKSWKGTADPSPYCATSFSEDERWCMMPSNGDASTLREMANPHRTNSNLSIRQASGVTFSHDGKLLAASSHSGFARLWDAVTLREIAMLRNFLQGVHSVAFSSDGKRLVTGSDGKEAIKVWAVESQQELLTLEGQGSAFFSSAFSPDDNVLGTMSQAGVLHLWRAPSWNEIERAEKATGDENQPSAQRLHGKVSTTDSRD
jgi:eukaryotic-like serine/threonine-protein kinase